MLVTFPGVSVQKATSIAQWWYILLFQIKIQHVSTHNTHTSRSATKSKRKDVLSPSHNNIHTHTHARAHPHKLTCGTYLIVLFHARVHDIIQRPTATADRYCFAPQSTLGAHFSPLVSALFQQLQSVNSATWVVRYIWGSRKKGSRNLPGVSLQISTKRYVYLELAWIKMQF